MVIAQYTDKFWYPDGTLATNIAVRIFPLNSNILAPLFADLAGTVPLANPVITNGSGVMSFYAEEGEYWLHADSESFRVSVGSPVLDPQEVAAATISTGIAAGGDISVNGSNPAAIDISPFVGYITSFTVDPFLPVVQRVTYPGGTVAMDAGSLARTVTSWFMDADLNIYQEAPPTSNAAKRTRIFLGFTAQVGGSIIVDQSLPIILQQPANQLADLMTALGPFSISGNAISANGANLKINQSAGTVFAQAFNHFVGPTQTNDPHVSTTQAQTPASFRYITRNSLVLGPLTDLIDVANYDVGGVVTPIGGGANTATIHRVFLFPNNTASEQLVFQYGQTAYSSLSAAVNAIGTGTFMPNPLMRTGALVCHIAAIRTATNLSDTTQAAFHISGKFETP